MPARPCRTGSSSLTRERTVYRQGRSTAATAVSLLAQRRSSGREISESQSIKPEQHAASLLPLRRSFDLSPPGYHLQIFSFDSGCTISRLIMSCIKFFQVFPQRPALLFTEKGKCFLR